MEEFFVPLWLLLIVLAPIAAFVWQFRRVRRGLCARFKGIAHYASYAAIPVLAYLGGFLALVALEELLATSLVGEGYARSIIIVGVGGIVLVIAGTIAFSIAVAFIDIESNRSPPDSDRRTR